jgi:hypothetical protein|tara:strand:+ start:125 stop:331 length:207 start_codon:yes stop_codon:yes gene_type:complete
MKNKKKEKMKIIKTDPFGFQKAINFEKLKDTEALKILSQMLDGVTPYNEEFIQLAHKKAVKTLKRKVR